MLNDHLRINEKGNLEIGGCDTTELVKEFGTPLYVMDEMNIRHNCRRYKQAMDIFYDGNGLVLYAGKAFLTMAMCKIIEQEGHYEKQAETKAQLLRLEEESASLESELVPTIISHEDISSVIEMWTGIPVKRISETESEKLMKLEDRLHMRVVGQEDAVSALARAIRRNRSGFGKKHKPASFIFVGPTGVGKTELVKAVAEAMFAREDALIRMDMSEFMEAHTVSKLIGSPPGYVGYDDGGQLTERVRRKPYSVILFDEIEKAHPYVFYLLLLFLFF